MNKYLALSSLAILASIFTFTSHNELTFLEGLFSTPTASAQLASQDWPQHQHDVQRTGYNAANLAGPFTDKWDINLNSAIAHRVQPVISNGIVVVGTLDGIVHGIDDTLGQVTWTYNTGGPISFSAAIDNGVVFVGSQDGNLYALNLTNGQMIWQTKTGRKPIGGAPLVYNNRVFVSGKDGFFRSYDAISGNLVWQHDSGVNTVSAPRAPILSSPSISPTNNLVFFSGENLVAYALDLDGNLQWTYQLYGESTYDSWPVVSESNNVVMFGTKPIYSFHSTLGLDDEDLFCPGDSGGACSSCASIDPDTAANNSPCDTVSSGACSTQWNEQHGATNSIDWIFNTWPQRRTFYAFDITTGNHIPAPILWTAGGGRLQILPVVDDITGDIYVMARSRYSRRDASYFCRQWVDLVRLSFTPTQGTFHFVPCNSGTSCSDPQAFHFIGDESLALSMAGDMVVGTGWYNTGGTYVRSAAVGLYEGISNWNDYWGDSIGSGGDSAAPASIAGNTVYVKQRPPGTTEEDGQTTHLHAYQGQ